MRQYESSWNNRCRFLFCCVHNSESNRVRQFIIKAGQLTNSFAESDLPLTLVMMMMISILSELQDSFGDLAKLLSEFFRDLGT